MSETVDLSGNVIKADGVELTGNTLDTLAAQTIAAASTDTSAALKTSTQTAVNNLVAAINDIIAVLKNS